MKIPKTGLSRVVEVIACAISIGALLNNANVNVIHEVMIIQQGGSPQLRSIFIVTLIFIGILVYLMSVYIAKNKKLNLIENELKDGHLQTLQLSQLAQRTTQLFLSFKDGDCLGPVAQCLLSELRKSCLNLASPEAT